jgi:hypothetical protein
MNPVVDQHSWESKAIPAGGRPDERLAVVVATAAGCRLASITSLASLSQQKGTIPLSSNRSPPVDPSSGGALSRPLTLLVPLVTAGLGNFGLVEPLPGIGGEDAAGIRGRVGGFG